MGRAEYRKGKKRRRLRKGRVFFLLLILFILFAGGYSIFQFKQGEKQSLGKLGVEEIKYEFNGEKDSGGGTNILLLGSDQRKGEKQSRTDTIMVAQYHPDKGTYKIISLMRDMYVDIPGYSQGRINTAYTLGGPELLRQTIKQNFDIDLQYYAIINFEGFEAVIDEAFPNGVEIDVEKQMSENIGVTLNPGLQRLNGKQLLGYVRFRHDAESDFGRVARQQKTLQAIADQVSAVQTFAKLPKLAGVIMPYINTSMETGDMLFIGKDLLTSKNHEVESLRVPVDGTFQDMRVNGAAVLSVDLEANTTAIKEFLAQ
ncbi:cell envelope-related transcriptional attenuator [Mycobacteroides abscessus subsp. abscessus]|nr:cell envelope-related transcriptional attenuator [Mycobacteroides abscessus subsp. abscessus]